MNDKIRELAEQADRWAQEMTWSADPRYGDRPKSDLFEEKFAELIVQECIDCINNTDKGGIFTAQSAGVVGAAHQRSIETIRQHFGVEE